MRGRRTRIKFCGMTRSDEIAAAVEAGADALGIILADSPRRVSSSDLPELRSAIPPFVTPVAVVAGESASLSPQLALLGFVVQYSGGEALLECDRLAGYRPYIKAFHIENGAPRESGELAAISQHANATVMFDTAAAGRAGGSGRTFDWSLVATLAAERPIIVSGGLTPENVGDCVRLVRPYAVDVRSGIETGGRKDAGKMRAFVRAVREADAEA